MFIDVHVLQTVPPSNINRDDTGSPKSAVFGGVRRARVSSQAWKRATRKAFAQLVDPDSLGVRTKRVVELVATRIEGKAPETVEPLKRAAEVLTAAGIKLEKPRRPKKDEPDEPEQSGYLLFLSASQIDRLADLAISAATTGEAIDKKAAKSAADGANSIDVALFGRMVADAADLNVDAAAQVAHAISVHAADPEFDYFTAVDDRSPEDNAGAGMIGTVEFNSSTLYRYATVNVAALQKNLGSADATVHAVGAFLDAFVRSMPTGKQNTFANRTLPAAVLFSVRSDQPVNLVGAFEEPVVTMQAGRVGAAVAALVAEFRSIESAYGDGNVENFAVTTSPSTVPLAELGQQSNLATAVDSVRERVAASIRPNS